MVGVWWHPDEQAETEPIAHSASCARDKPHFLIAVLVVYPIKFASILQAIPKMRAVLPQLCLLQKPSHWAASNPVGYMTAGLFTKDLLVRRLPPKQTNAELIQNHGKCIQDYVVRMRTDVVLKSVCHAGMRRLMSGSMSSTPPGRWGMSVFSKYWAPCDYHLIDAVPRSALCPCNVERIVRGRVEPLYLR